MTRRVCLAMGVSTVTPISNNEALRFAFLDGAVLAARAIGDWAIRSGFTEANVRVIHDGSVAGKVNPVTRDRIQKAVDELFPPGSDVVEHLILAFCGHGLTDPNIGTISWLFSDSLRLKYRVVADKFYTELLLHGVKHITLISDACREAPKNLDLMRLDDVRGITAQGIQVESPKFDRLAACQDGQLGYMVADPDLPSVPGKCVFSGVIADVLWGLEPAAIVNGVITTATLGACARARTNERARDYHLKLNPQCVVDPNPVLLYATANPPNGPNGLQPWPPAKGSSALSAGTQPAGEMISTRARTDADFRNQFLNSGFGLKLHKFVAPIITIPSNSENPLEDFVVPEQPITRAPIKRRKVKALLQRLNENVGVDQRSSAAREVRHRLQQIDNPDEADLFVWGEHAKLWSKYPVKRLNIQAGFLKFRVEDDALGAPILVELADGAFTPIVPYESLYAVITSSATGDVYHAYGKRSSREHYLQTLKTIEDFAAGRLSAQNIDQLSALLRYKKPRDPVLDIICAYLYRSIADYDSIRHMAYSYAALGQPVPFDIALLGAMRVVRKKNGALELHVPPVKARPERHKMPNSIQDTPCVRGQIGGRCPWLGLGWDYVKDPRPDWLALVDGLAEHSASVRRSGFTLLPKRSAYQLAASWGLRLRM